MPFAPGVAVRLTSVIASGRLLAKVSNSSVRAAHGHGHTVWRDALVASGLRFAHGVGAGCHIGEQIIAIASGGGNHRVGGGHQRDGHIADARLVRIGNTVLTKIEVDRARNRAERLIAEIGGGGTAAPTFTSAMLGDEETKPGGSVSWMV